MTDPADIPPHLADEPPMQSAPVRPIEAAAVHFRGHGRCYAAMVVDVVAEDPLDPDFTVDLVVFQPRDRSRTDRFTKASTLPGHVRWANDLKQAMPAQRGEPWPDTTWHFPGALCLPEVVLSQGEPRG
jgi:hypothetical protein